MMAGEEMVLSTIKFTGKEVGRGQGQRPNKRNTSMEGTERRGMRQKGVLET